jgi:hypothetical protein
MRRPIQTYTFRAVNGIAAPAYALSLFSTKDDGTKSAANSKVELFASVDKLHEKCKYKEAYCKYSEAKSMNVQRANNAYFCDSAAGAESA